MTAGAADFKSLTDYAFWSSDVQDDGLVEVRRLVDEGRCSEACPVFERFREFAQKHMRIEEKLLFPVAIQAAPAVVSTVATLRTEHDLMRDLLSQLRDALDKNDASRFVQVFEELGGILAGHETVEERVLYPLLDRAVPDRERAVLLRQLARTH